MKQIFRRFLRRDDGVVTVDWVVLTAAIIGLSISVIVIFKAEVSTSARYIDNETTRPEPLEF
ncbi:hypothetical protein DRV84_01665 [Rhodosalinus sediminis]|uniref:Pilus assembly protein n=1 Tax=Rhodosalinus sediminis TaxID=1940533 RepID=A0A3D9BZN0_9RHOB|nr:hypothetical protein [Rhodosalinus sediminis]REC58954.1 hypothetical protein DRV84_01665 [Rhodosalinus sediminis]